VAVAGLGAAVYLPTRNDTADAAERGRNGSHDRQRAASQDSFAEEFDGDGLDQQRWALAFGEAAVKDGDLRLGGPSRLVTRNTFQRESGRLEARVKLESGHAGLEVLTGGRKGQSFNVLGDAVKADGFHTYAIDWTAGTIATSVDGEETGRVTASGDRAFALALTTGESSSVLVDFVRITAVPSPQESKEPEPEPTPTASATETEKAAVAWKEFEDFTAGQIVTYEGVKYEVLEAHTALPGWTPTALPALFKKVS
jgi:hypothetical protein